MTSNTIEEKLAPYVKAMMGASGLNEEQAKTCVYYALATYSVKEEECSIFPILLLLGNHGTGKSSTWEQLYKMVNSPKLIGGRTEATVRAELNGAVTAFIDEGDTIPGIEKLLTFRYSWRNSTLQVNQPTKFGGYDLKEANIFGATVLCRRRPFQDVALRSRAIIIRTKKKQGQYQLVDVPDISEVAKMINTEIIPTSDRIMDTWKPILSIAHAVGDTEWVGYAKKQIQAEQRHEDLIQGIEPNDAMVYALKIHSSKGADRVKVSELRETLRNEYDTRLKVAQVFDICQGLKIPIIKPQGYPYVVLDNEKIDSLLRELETEQGGEKKGDI